MKTTDQELIKSIFKSNWNELFITCSAINTHYTYGSFFSLILHYICFLKSEGVTPGSRLGLLLPNCISMLAFYFVAPLLKLILVPIDPLMGEKFTLDLLQISDADILLTNRDIFFDGKKIMFQEKENLQATFLPVAQKELDRFDTINTEELLLVTYTSGTTGSPKGVKHNLHNLISSAKVFKTQMGYSKNNIFLHNLPMTYMAGILNLFILPFISEGRIVLANRFSCDLSLNFWEIPIRYRVNTFWFIPTIISLLTKIDRGSEGINYAKETEITASVGTAPLGLKLRNDFENKYTIPLYESYGLSELLFISTQSPGISRTPLSVGHLLKGVEYKFENGELILKTPWHFLGYDNIETPYSSWYLTGDLGIINKDKNLFITGRKKDLIIKGGVNISPKQIEEYLLQTGYFRETSILGMPDEILGEKIVCFYSSNSSVQSKRDILSRINAEIKTDMGELFSISSFYELKNLPKNLNGKIDKDQLKIYYYDNQN